MPPDPVQPHDPVERVAARVHEQLLAGHTPSTGAHGDRSVAELVRAAAPLLTDAEVRRAVRAVEARVLGLGALEPLVADPAVTEIMVSGPGTVFVERGGAIEPTGIHLDAAGLALLVERVVAPLGLRADRSAPIVDARLPDGSRVNVILPPLALDGPCVTIRRFSPTAVPLDAFCSPAVAELLRWAVRARWNVLVSGATAAGKTTLLNALASELPPHERVITVEDAAELRLPGTHVVRLESRPATADGVGAVTIRQLVRNALRMRPDRIIVGEVRGAEALDMLQAMNTGHDGSLSTCHANGPDDALRRVETMVLFADAGLPLAAVREHLESALDLVVHVARDSRGGRRVREVAEVCRQGGGRATTARAREPGAEARTRTLAGPDGAVVAAPTRPARQPDPSERASA
jgi:pilus assembly protein CpaF